MSIVKGFNKASDIYLSVVLLLDLIRQSPAVCDSAVTGARVPQALSTAKDFPPLHDLYAVA